jgi:uncharacterized circularly permuted ATP-grasp superfamily protein/uncharacterized alpha-E superfamily protein
MIAGCLDHYSGDTRRYDELLERTGGVRAHWRPLIERLSLDWPDAARRSVELARRLVVENGVTYNVYADPQGRDRPWPLDPLPLLLTAAEWRGIEAGVQQRARALDALLADLYGGQRVFASGVAPPELAFGHPNFLPACEGALPAGRRHLHIYAVDLARSRDGHWWVLADRTQAPSGAGYALENRQIVSRVFPDLGRELGVRSLAPFFASLRDSLIASDDDAPLAVVLTPGPYNETYFEHAYLARQLGLLLVEGHDLTVRGDTLYLKTLAGLKRVHAVLRRLDDDFCDPLELRGDSALGVPGLLGVARAGRVVVANALGSGVLESAAWLGFMPGIAHTLTGEPLLLPSVASWWCGEKPALAYVEAHLDELVIKPAFPNQRFEPVFGEQLSRAAKAELIGRIRARPQVYVAQERMALSQAPAWRTSGPPALAATAVTMRVYAVATRDGYEVMPGGLARTASESAIDVTSAQRGGGSKDIWVLPGDADPDATPSLGPVARVTRHDELPSRLGENLFWLGRYAERCDDKARLLRAALAVRADRRLWARALDTCRRFGVVGDEADPVPKLFDAERPLGLPADIRRLAWCATEVRGRLSIEHWRTVGVLQRQLQEAAPARSDPRETLDRLLRSLTALVGFGMDDMAQDDGWRLMMLGRRLERLQFSTQLLAHCAAGPVSPSRAEVEWLLDVQGSTVDYRTRYAAAPRLALALDLLIRDPQQPRSLVFQRDVIARESAQLARSLGTQPEDPLEAPVRALVETDHAALEGNGPTATTGRIAFAARLGELASVTAQLSDRLTMRHFSHVDDELHSVAS